MVLFLIALLAFCKSTSSSNEKPNAPTDPTPADGAQDVPLYTTLMWQGSDPDEDALTYDVYLGLDQDLGNSDIIADDLDANEFATDKLNYVTKYFWKVKADDGQKDTQTSEIWEFTTENLYEDFSDNIANDFLFDDNRWSVAGGNLKMNGNSNDTWASTYYDQEFKDFHFTTRVARLQSNQTIGGSFGVFFRSNGYMEYDQGLANGYLLSVVAEGVYSVWLEKDGQESEIIPWTNNANISYGLNAFSKIEIIAVGSNFEIYINDAFIDSFTDNTFPEGNITLTTFDSSNGPNEVWFQYYNVETPSIRINTTSDYIPHTSQNSAAYLPK